METISGYDKYRTSSPEEAISEQDINILERNLAPCPFCLRHPFFEDSAHDTNVFISCHCGAQMSGSDWFEVSAKWATRPPPVARSTVRPGSYDHWTGW